VFTGMPPQEINESKEKLVIEISELINVVTVEQRTERKTKTNNQNNNNNDSEMR
jgi:hypothetical protein